ncbi:MAG: orotate phosphoribosyltransferase [Campylobacterales bacterium]|nr:orotate phosphoribosyltransferase [Campylobacterales bacterium]
MNIEQIYKDAGALLEGHFILSSGNHSNRYLQSAKVLENPQTSQKLAIALAKLIRDANITVETICAPALGGVIAGYELARALNVRSIFAERKEGSMQLRRGFEVQKGEKIIVCEDIITTGGSAMEVAAILSELGADVVAFASLANRGFCKRIGSNTKAQSNCKLPKDVPLFSLEDFNFEMYDPTDCPLCKAGSKAIKPGSRN